MDKKILKLFSLPILILSSCNSNKGPSKSLDHVGGLNYEDGILSFNSVERATVYEYIFSHKGEVVYQDTLESNAIDVEALGMFGEIEVKITAKNDKEYSDTISYSFTILSTFSDVILEAENYLYNFGTGKSNSNFRNNPLASNGAYVGGLDDAGQGIFINYLSPFDGSFEVESHYCYHPTVAGINEAHHDVWVNNEYQTKFVYNQDTEWGGARFDAAISKTNITLKKGWNTISLMKNGNSRDNWGDFAEIDYLLIKGNNQKYNMDDLQEYGETPKTYRLEAEMGSPRKKDPESGLYLCKNPCIAEHDNAQFSNGFLMGGVENKYDGVEWHFDSPVKAKYSISLSYAAGEFEGCKQAKPSFIVTQKTVELSKNVDFLDLNPIEMMPLEYTGWDNPTLADEKIELELEQGDNFIYCLLLDGSGFFQIDYCDLTFESEI